MLKDLIKQKEQLEQEKEYMAFFDGLASRLNTKEDFAFGNGGCSLADIWSRINTEDVALKCEETMEKLIHIFSKYDIPFKNISMASSPQFYIKKHILEEARPLLDSKKNLHEFLLKRCENHILENIIPVTFVLDPNSMWIPVEYLPDGKTAMNVGEYLCEKRNSEIIKEIEDYCNNLIFSGIINFNRFVKFMEKNGYSVYANDVYKPNFKTYLSGYFEHIEENSFYDLNINADFSRGRK